MPFVTVLHTERSQESSDFEISFYTFSFHRQKRRFQTPSLAWPWGTWYHTHQCISIHARVLQNAIVLAEITLGEQNVIYLFFLSFFLEEHYFKKKKVHLLIPILIFLYGQEN